MNANPEQQEKLRRRRDVTVDLAARIATYVRMQGLTPGTHLPSQKLANLFGVSRSPINQALTILASKGLTEHVSNSGFYVSNIEGDGLEEFQLNREHDPNAIYFKIAEDRLKGALPDSVSEKFLQDTYKLTRGELNELLSRMSKEGWIERRLGYGWNFTPILSTPQALEHSYRLRLAIEPAALLEPSFHLPRDEAEKCLAIEQRLREGEFHTISADMLFERGVNFHETLAKASRNFFFLDALRRVNRMRRLFAYRTMIDRKRFEGEVDDHIRMLDLLMCGRNEEAAEVMNRHLLAVVRNLRDVSCFLEKSDGKKKHYDLRRSQRNNVTQ